MSQHDDSSAPTQFDIHNADTQPDVVDPRSSAANAATAPVAAPRYHLVLDLWRGTFLGAYAIDDLRMPGLFMWVVVGFIPVLGTLAAVRDAYYSVEVHEWGGLVFNLVGLLPFMKGFTNIIEVSHLTRLRHVAHATHQVLRVVRQERKVSRLGAARKGSRRLATVVTGAAHDAGAVSILMAPRPLPGRNKAAWPALLLALISALILPVVMLVVLDVLAGASYFSHTAPLTVSLGSGIFALAVSAAVVVLAHRARRTAKLMTGRPFSRGMIAGLAVGFAWLGLLASVVVMATIVYIERAALPHL